MPGRGHRSENGHDAEAAPKEIDVHGYNVPGLDEEDVVGAVGAEQFQRNTLIGAFDERIRPLRPSLR